MSPISPQSRVPIPELPTADRDRCDPRGGWRPAYVCPSENYGNCAGYLAIRGLRIRNAQG